MSYCIDAMFCWFSKEFDQI